MAVTDNTGVGGNFALNSTVDATSYVTPAATPVVNDLIVLLFGVTDVGIPGTISDTQGLGWDRLVTNFGPATLKAHLAIAQTLAASTSMTITYDCTGDTASGIYLQGRRINGGRSTPPFYRQFASDTGGAGTTPQVTFDNPCNTLNGVFGFVVNSTNPAALTPPGSWIETADTGHATPDMGGWYGRRLSGETGTTITWGSTSATEWVALAVEIYVTGQPTTKPYYYREFANS